MDQTCLFGLHHPVFQVFDKEFRVPRRRNKRLEVAAELAAEAPVAKAAAGRLSCGLAAGRAGWVDLQPCSPGRTLADRGERSPRDSRSERSTESILTVTRFHVISRAKFSEVRKFCMKKINVLTFGKKSYVVWPCKKNLFVLKGCEMSFKRESLVWKHVSSVIPNEGRSG